MISFFEIIHTLAAILLLGPVTISTWTFGSLATAAKNGSEHAQGQAKIAFTVTKIYGLFSLIIPVAGLAMFLMDEGYLKEGKYHASIALSVIAWVVLIFVLIPQQKKLMANLNLLDPGEDEEVGDKTIGDWDKTVSTLRLVAGLFIGLWIIVFILMVL